MGSLRNSAALGLIFGILMVMLFDPGGPRSIDNARVVLILCASALAGAGLGWLSHRNISE